MRLNVYINNFCCSSLHQLLHHPDLKSSLHNKIIKKFMIFLVLTRKDGILGIAARNPRPKPLKANDSKPSVPASKILFKLGAGCADLDSSLVTLEDFK